MKYEIKKTFITLDVTLLPSGNFVVSPVPSSGMWPDPWRCVLVRGFPGGSDGKESVCNAGDMSSISGSGRSPGEGNGNPL